VHEDNNSQPPFQRLQHHCVEAVLAFYHKVESRIPLDVGLVSKGLVRGLQMISSEVIYPGEITKKKIHVFFP
jgi:hypothetical protein